MRLGKEANFDLYVKALTTFSVTLVHEKCCFWSKAIIQRRVLYLKSENINLSILGSVVLTVASLFLCTFSKVAETVTKFRERVHRALEHVLAKLLPACLLT